MRWLRGIITAGLVVAVAAIALVTGLSDHSDDYGEVSLPQGGVVHLPEGKVTIFLKQLGDQSDPIRQVTTPFGFQVLPVGGGSPVPVTSQNGAPVADAVTRSETIGELGAVAKLQVPATGEYEVVASGSFPAGSSFLDFGTNAGQALAARWKLLAGLLIAAVVIALIPMPRSRRRWEDDAGAPTGWSDDPRAPYAG
jgi:hypothetical protein